MTAELTLTIAILVAAVAVYSWKLLGHLVPARLHSQRFQTFADAVTIALLAALIGIQGFTTAGAVAFDERILALVAALLLLLARAPFIVVVVAAAAIAAVLRML